MEQKYTIEEVLKATAQMLNSLSIPVSFIESLGVPIAKAVNNLEQCIIAINMDREEKTEGVEDGREADSE